MSNISAIVAGIAFVSLAATNVVVMLEASQPARSVATRTRLIALHRAGGYLFVMLLCIMAYGMSQRLASLGITSHLPTHLVLHIVLVIALLPLLFLKILIARRYRQSHSLLKALGVTIFLVAFVLVAIPTFSELLRSSKPGGLWLRLATGAVVVACLVRCALVFTKRKQSPAFAESSRIPAIPAQATPSNSLENAKSLSLLLVQTEQQTNDTKTLRFRLPEERRLSAKPGQFLTFQWPIDGQRVTRSYTISSSPLHENYVEITPKRMENGCVSVFLNERADPGLRVKASGPYGRFYFDEKVHKRIVLIAAGSGITPMISMLRYIDDLKLATSVTLLYCVRTAADIIFENELSRLGRSLPNFKYQVCLSRPDSTWQGHSGRLTGEFVSRHVTDPVSATFFLCGPKGFMDNARQILLTLGVSQHRILQESFGESKRSMESQPMRARPVETVVFSHSEKVCQLAPGSTLLDLAEQNDVKIPYGCRQGLCGTCATRVLSGAVQMDVEAGLTAEQKNAGYVLPCVSRAEGTVVLLA
ncbi:MAG TPA: iron-sulfur cluster-binding domain-containing protein [Candidatus Polarisedimenticolia bacterium]|nr:iron-sulfur cluster-binding domain-containing protein [Candidatus Polarisedimenticolia bacterium]